MRQLNRCYVYHIGELKPETDTADRVLRTRSLQELPMSHDNASVTHSPSAKAIQASCQTLTCASGFTLADPLCWTWTSLPDLGEPPYRLGLRITDPVSGYTAHVPLDFTREEVLGYATGLTTTAVEQKIRGELAGCRREADCKQGAGASRRWSLLHGR